MKKSLLFLFIAFGFNSQVLSESVQYFCDIDALQTIDLSKDVSGYYQDDYDKVWSERLSKA